jgi:hypothetical protein
MIVRATIEVDQQCWEGDAMQNRPKRQRAQGEYDRNRLFHTTEQTQGRVTQTTNVTVTVTPEPKESCFDALKACFGLAAKGASAA